jgi:hypothetical protein
MSLYYPAFSVQIHTGSMQLPRRSGVQGTDADQAAGHNSGPTGMY